MDAFSLCLDGLCLAGQSVLHVSFAGRLTGKRPRLWHLAGYFALLCAIEAIAVRLRGGALLPIGAGMLALYAVCRLGLGIRRPAAWLTAVLAFYLSQLSFGILNSLEAVVFPCWIGTPLLYVLVTAALAASFVLCAGCYAAVGRLLALDGACETPYLGLLLLPGLFFFGAELYILHTAYRFAASPSPPGAAGTHGVLLLLQAMGLAALFCTLYAYRQLCRGFQARAALQSLTQAARAQKGYIAEAQLREERTRAFRHDIKNHLSVLDGLLSGGKLEEGRAYLSRLEAESNALSYPYQTGNPVVDILLGEKLGLAEDIEAEVSLTLPRPCGIDDFDLCVIFANALDNALSACRACGETQSLRITGRRQGDFYLLVFENTCAGGPLPPEGTGLASIRSAAEKYRGAVLAEKDGRRFSLHVLLNIS